jgi:hypothetical protein
MKQLISTLAYMLAVVAAACAYPQDFHEAFTYPDGSLPPDWTWTGDPQGGGAFRVQGGQFVHMDGGYAYYVRVAPNWCAEGLYEFDVKDSNWEFAWGIQGTPDSGWCCRLYHNDAWGRPGYTLAASTWTTLPGYPGGQYMFHNATDLQVSHYWTEPLVGWHHIRIFDALGHMEIDADYSQVLFSGWTMGPYGHVGLGATVGSGTLTPAFDNVEHMALYSPVEGASWGRVKALFR